jgi:phosphopantothenoylcysteine synthetase/decarboxylase
MYCIVTAGPTFEPLDEVRRLTNFSAGRLGTELANFLTAQGHEVTLLIGESATYRGERRTKKVQVFSTTSDLRSQLKALAGNRVGAIFHAAAVSDFSFGKLFQRDARGTLRPFRSSKKISTRSGNLMVELVPTPKIIAELRGWFPQAILCGWKFEANGGRTDALRAAERQMADCGTDYCVANGPAYGKGFCLVGQADRKHFARPETLFKALERSLG